MRIARADQESFYADMAPQTPSPAREPRHGAQARLRFLDETAFWEGRLNRSDLMQRFGVSVPQATADLAQYQAMAPGNLIYDRHSKAYLAAPSFQPAFGTPSAEEWLRAGGTDVAAMPVEPLPLPRRTLDPWVLRRLLAVWRARRAVRVLYQPVDDRFPEPAWRWVSPTAFASDGLRWHLRAYNHDAARHEDLLLPRMFELGEERDCEPPSTDVLWEEKVLVRLRPAASLSPSQRQAVAADYGMANGETDVEVRAAMLASFLRRLRLDVGSRLIEVVNADEVQAAVRRVDATFGGAGVSAQSAKA